MKVEKIVTQDQTDVNFLSIYKFPSLDDYKKTIRLAKQQAERAFHFRLVYSCFKPNKLQLLGVLAHLQLSGVQGVLPRLDSLATLNSDGRSQSNQSIVKQRFITAGQKKRVLDRKTKPLLACHACLILTLQDAQMAPAEALSRYFGLIYNQQFR